MAAAEGRVNVNPSVRPAGVRAQVIWNVGEYIVWKHIRTAGNLGVVIHQVRKHRTVQH